MADGGFLSHIEALRKAVLEILAIFVILLIPGWIFAPDLLALLQAAAARIAEKNGSSGFELRYFTLMEPFIVELKAGMVLAFGAGLPLYFWRFWRFLAPALYRHEQKVLLGGAIAAWVLFAAGFALGVLGVMPMLVKFSLSFARDGLTPLIGFNNFVGLMMTVSLAFGAMFELPLVLLALAMAGVISLDTLKKQRPLVLVIILIMAAFLTPPDVISQLMLGVPTYLLFELTLLSGKFLIKKSPDEAYGDSETTASETEIPTESVDEASEVDSDEGFAQYYRRPRKKRRSNDLPPRRRSYRR